MTTPQDVLRAVEDRDPQALSNLLQHIHPDAVFEPETGAPLLHTIAALIESEIVSALLGATLRAGATVDISWPDLSPEHHTSHYTAMAHATRWENAAAIRALLSAGANPHQLILASPHDLLWGAGFTPAALLHDDPELLAEIPDAPPALLDDPAGRWELTLNDYHMSDWPRSILWEGEEDHYTWLDLNANGTFVLEEWTGGQDQGTWSRDGNDIRLEGDMPRTLTLSHGGYAARIDYSDEETGYRGDATFWYVRAEVTHGHPLRS